MRVRSREEEVEQQRMIFKRGIGSQMLGGRGWVVGVRRSERFEAQKGRKEVWGLGDMPDDGGI